MKKQQQRKRSITNKFIKVRDKKRSLDIRGACGGARARDRAPYNDRTATGHFKLPLWKDEEVNVCITEMETNEQRKVLTKLHRQFRHNSTKATEDLLRNAGLLNDKIKRINKEVVAECDICKQYKKTPARPVVALPIAKKFNDVVAMDLKIVKNGSAVDRREDCNLPLHLEPL